MLDQALRKARIEEYHIRASAAVDRVGEDEPAEEVLARYAGRISRVGVDLTLKVPRSSSCGPSAVSTCTTPAV